MDKLTLWGMEVTRIIDSNTEHYLRLGQIYMIALRKTDEGLYEKIQEGIYDCFYDDSKCNTLTDKLISFYTKEGMNGK